MKLAHQPFAGAFAVALFCTRRDLWEIAIRNSHAVTREPAVVRIRATRRDSVRGNRDTTSNPASMTPEHASKAVFRIMVPSAQVSRDPAATSTGPRATRAAAMRH